jgi:predicted HAD superfamily Cof-like phosphohydrolase
MESRQILVEDFHRKSGQDIDMPFDGEKLAFRMKLISEEFKELAEAAFEAMAISNDKEVNQEELNSALAHFLKELSDCSYVLEGTGVAFGWDLDEAFTRVHESNMSKMPFEKDESGKVLKSKKYKPPTLEDLIID